MADFGIKISKKGVDVKSAGYKDLILSSQFDTFKVRRTGTLTLNLPQEIFPAWEQGEDPSNNEITRYVSYTHNIGDIAFFYPLQPLIVAYIGVSEVTNGGSYNVADIEERDWFPSSHEPTEEVTVLQLANEIRLQVERYHYDNFPVTFGARTVTLDYTIFHNRVDMEFNLL